MVSTPESWQNKIEAPVIRPIIDLSIVLPPYKKLELSNGVEVIMVEDNNNEFTGIGFTFAGGVIYQSKTGVAKATFALLLEGTDQHSTEALSDTFDYWAADIDSGCGIYTAQLEVSCLTKNLGTVLPLVAEILSSSNFPQAKLDKYITDKIEDREARQKDPVYVANRSLKEMLFGNGHNYFRYATDEDLRNISRSDLLTHFDQVIRTGACRIMIVGNCTDSVVSDVERYFGSLPLKKLEEVSRLAFMEVNPMSEKERQIVIKDNENAEIRIARCFPMPGRREMIQLSMLNHILGGDSIDSRLMANIREKKGYTYSIGSDLVDFDHHCVLEIETSTPKKKASDAVKAICKELELLARDGVSEEELIKCKALLFVETLDSIKDVLGVAEIWDDLLTEGKDENAFYEEVRTLRETTTADLKALAQKYLDPSAFHRLIIR